MAIYTGNNYPYRNDMLNDLISKRKLKGLTKDEITPCTLFVFAGNYIQNEPLPGGKLIVFRTFTGDT